MDYSTSFKVIGDGTVKCATPGTAVQLNATSTPCRKVRVTAFAENAGRITVGSSTTLATANAARGRGLNPGESETFPVNDVNLLYMDALNANDGLSYEYYRTDN